MTDVVAREIMQCHSVTWSAFFCLIFDGLVVEPALLRIVSSNALPEGG